MRLRRNYSSGSVFVILLATGAIVYFISIAFGAFVSLPDYIQILITAGVLLLSGLLVFLTIFRIKKRKKLEIEMMNKLVSNYPAYEKNIREKTVSVGMPLDLVTGMLGAPADVKRQATSKKLKARCFYFPYSTQRGTIHYKFQIDFENDQVIAWKDI